MYYTIYIQKLGILLKRRYIAAIAIFMPILIAAIAHKFYPDSYEIVSAYMVAVAVAFKGAILSFFLASKLKIIAFLKSLTLLNSTILLIKRWFLDNIFAKWLEKNLINPLKNSILITANYYKKLSFKAKLKNIALPIITFGAFGYIAYHSGYLSNLLLFTEIKVFVIGLSKAFLALIVHIFSFIIDSWITPILEVFALSFILNWLEDKLGSSNPFIKFLNSISALINSIINIFINLDNKIDPFINKPVAKRARAISLKLSKYINNKKISHEYQQFEALERKIMKAHIDSYYSFKDMDKIKDKKELYALINKKSRDNLNIVAFLSRNSKGELLDEDVEDSFYHDIFILEGIASSKAEGVKQELSNKPDSTDFWVLNTSNFPATLQSKHNKFNTTTIEPNSLKLIQVDGDIDYKDICFNFKNTTKCVTLI